MRGNKIRGNITQALGKNKPEIPIADLTPASPTADPHLCAVGRFKHKALVHLRPLALCFWKEKKIIKKKNVEKKEARRTCCKSVSHPSGLTSFFTCC